MALAWDLDTLHLGTFIQFSYVYDWKCQSTCFDFDGLLTVDAQDICEAAFSPRCQFSVHVFFFFKFCYVCLDAWTLRRVDACFDWQITCSAKYMGPKVPKDVKRISSFLELQAFFTL